MASLKYKRLDIYSLCRSQLWLHRISSHHLVREQKFLICLAVLSFISLCFTALLKPSNIVFETTSTKRSDNYGVIVDCGSSGSRAHIYTWPSWADNPLILHEMQPLKDEDGKEYVMKIEPGLSSFEDKPDDASIYMRPLMEFIARVVPVNKHVDTHIYFMATAGMRLLGRRTQQEIMDDLKKDLPQSYGFPNIDAQVITGQQEGLYSWITVNSKLRRFDISASDSMKQKTIGMIEMGGASVQVAFEVSPLERMTQEKSLDTSLYRIIQDSIMEVDLSCRKDKHKYRLFVNTFLGVGANNARDASVDLLVTAMMACNPNRDFSNDDKISLVDPCLPKNMTETVKRPKALLVRQAGGEPRQTIGLDYDDDKPSIEVTLKGSGSMKHCMDHLSRLIDVAKKESMNCENPLRCPMSLLGTIFIPFKSHEFYGLSEFYYSTQGMIGATGLFNRAQVVSQTNRKCSSSSENHYDAEPDHVLRKCFKAAWILTFLEHGLGLPNNFSNLSIAEKINGEEIDWSLGAMIEKSIELEKEFSIGLHS